MILTNAQIFIIIVEAIGIFLVDRKILPYYLALLIFTVIIFFFV